MKLDKIDLKILSILQDDATTPVQQIADEVGLTNNPCWRRIKRLEETGVIERRIAVINPQSIGLGITAFVSIRIDAHNESWLESFAKSTHDIPEIVECHRMTGDIDYLLKVLVRDLSHYDKVYRRLLAAVPGLKDVSSAFSMERLKNATAIDASTSVLPE